MEQTSAAVCAAAILNAWEAGDSASVRRQLDAALNASATPDVCELERERRDLISAIAETMRDAQSGCDMQPALALLRHLVSSAPSRHL